MWNAVKKQFRLQWNSWAVGAAITLGAALIGLILWIVLMWDDPDITSYFPMGTLLGGIALVMYSFFTVIGQVQGYFNLEISMGCTRKHFYVSTLVLDIVMNAIGVLLLSLVSLGEKAVYEKLYPVLEKEINVIPYLVKGGLAAAVMLPALAFLCGTVILRYGRRAFWILWVIWMFGCLGVPKIHDATETAPDSLFGKIGTGVGRVIQAVPVNIWLFLGIAACLACLVISYLFIRKQEVTSI